MNNPKICVVGAGYWGRNHIRTLHDLGCLGGIAESNKELLSALKGNLDNAPKNWWWAKYIPRFMYPYIVWRLKRNPTIVNCELQSLSKSISQCEIKKINLLKVDCEGNELKVLNGIKDSDWDIISQFIIEVHDIDGRLEHISNMMKEKQYKVKQNPIQKRNTKSTKLPKKKL